jgi:hypothetical protein
MCFDGEYLHFATDRANNGGKRWRVPMLKLRGRADRLRLAGQHGIRRCEFTTWFLKAIFSGGPITSRIKVLFLMSS